MGNNIFPSTSDFSGKAITRKDAYMKKEIHKINDGKMAEGVCGDIAKYFGIDVGIVRFIWLLLCLAGGIGIWLYLICTIAMPKERD